MANYRHLQVIEETNPQNPNDGSPYVLYNPEIDKVWIFMGLKWILETGIWEESKKWANDGIWHYYDANY